ncbi:unnamed protein product, partial [Thelazia callipaeda]|uniref:GAR domain-containing protein n=1 Tax=Thelazia callipaeda TaxID=103827 RepID=A0A0N5CT07_THECL
LKNWCVEKEEIESEIRVTQDEYNKLLTNYSQAQPYMVAVNDINILQELQHKLVSILQMIKDKEEVIIKSSKYHPVLNMISSMKQNTEKFADDIEKLLLALTEDVSIQKELINTQNDLINDIYDLNVQAENIGNILDSEEQKEEINRIRTGLEKVSEKLNELKKNEEKPIKLVLHSDELKVVTIFADYEKVNKLVSDAEKRHIQNQNMQMEMKNLREELCTALDDAYKVENDANASAINLQEAVIRLKNARQYLERLQDIYDQLPKTSDADLIRTETMKELSLLNERYDNLERSLEERVDALKKFEEIAHNISEELRKVESDARELEAPNADCNLTVADEGFNRITKLQNAIEKLYELKEEQLSSISIADICNIDELSARLSYLSNIFHEWRDDVMKKKQEFESENNLSGLINDLQQTLADAENGLNKIDVTASNELNNFKDIVLPTILEKSSHIKELMLSVKTDKEKELYQQFNILYDQHNDLAKRVDEKLNSAKEQDKMHSDIEKLFDHVEEESNNLLNKYNNPQELVVAVEDVNYLHSLLDEISSSSVDNIINRQVKKHLAKREDFIKNHIRNLLIPLEKDCQKEQELMHNLRETLNALNSMGDEVIGIEVNNIDTIQQSDKIDELIKNLQQLKGQIKKLEEKLQTSEGLVKRDTMNENLSDRVTLLQKLLDDKKQKLMNQAEVNAILPKIYAITECVQNYINQFEESPMQTVDEQNAALSELESKKIQLEHLLNNIPSDEQGDELREKSNWVVEELNNLLKRLADAVGKKLAALAAFNATKDELDLQLSSIESAITASDTVDQTVSALENHLHDIKDKFTSLEKLKNKVCDVDEKDLDIEQITEKQNLLNTIENTLQRLKVRIMV